jgi:hypothetical protein
MSPNLLRITFLAIAMSACCPAIGRAQGTVGPGWTNGRAVR